MLHTLTNVAKIIGHCSYGSVREACDPTSRCSCYIFLYLLYLSFSSYLAESLCVQAIEKEGPINYSLNPCKLCCNPVVFYSTEAVDLFIRSFTVTFQRPYTLYDEDAVVPPRPVQFVWNISPFKVSEGIQGARHSLSVDPLVHMSTKEISLGLDQIGRQPFAPVAIVKREGGGHCGDRNSVHDSCSNNATPSLQSSGEVRIAYRLALSHFIGKERI